MGTSPVGPTKQKEAKALRANVSEKHREAADDDTYDRHLPPNFNLATACDR